MSLDVTLTKLEPVSVYSGNITHNLTSMAKAVRISNTTLYDVVWRSENISKAEELIHPLREGLKELESKPEYYKKFDPPNGWGSYETLVQFIKEYLNACIENPDADIEISR